MRPTQPAGTPPKTHYHRQERLESEGGVETWRGLDPLNGLPVRIYSFAGEPTAPTGVLSLHIPVVLASSHYAGRGEVITAFSSSYRQASAPVSKDHVKALLRGSAAALDDAARAGVIHGDLRPERVFSIDEAERPDVPPRRRYLLEGYGVPWAVRASEYNPPERIGGASYAGDVFSWAMTMRALGGPLPGEVRDLLLSCLDADPAARPHARDLCAVLARCSWHDPAPLQDPPPAARALEDVTDPASPPAAQGDHPAAADSSPAVPPTVQVRPRSETPDSTPDAAEAFSRFGAADEADNPTFTHLSEAFSPPPVRVLQRAPAEGAAVNTPADAPPEPIGESEPTGGGSKDERPENAQPNRAERTAQTDSATGSAAEGDALRRTDATEAYRQRRAAYEAQRPTPPTDPPSGASEGAAVRGGGVSGARPRRFDPDDDFEVIDDIDDRAPDPTALTGGRRVLLLSLLVIASLVLLALLLFNP